MLFRSYRAAEAHLIKLKKPISLASEEYEISFLINSVFVMQRSWGLLIICDNKWLQFKEMMV